MDGNINAVAEFEDVVVNLIGYTTTKCILFQGVLKPTGRRTLVVRLATWGTLTTTREPTLPRVANTTLSKGPLDTESTPLGKIKFKSVKIDCKCIKSNENEELAHGINRCQIAKNLV